MTRARVVKQGHDQLVVIPPQYSLTSEEVDLFRRGDELVIREEQPEIAPASDKPFGTELVEIMQSFSDGMIDAIIEAKRLDRERK